MTFEFFITFIVTRNTRVFCKFNINISIHLFRLVFTQLEANIIIVRNISHYINHLYYPYK